MLKNDSCNYLYSGYGEAAGDAIYAAAAGMGDGFCDGHGDFPDSGYGSGSCDGTGNYSIVDYDYGFHECNGFSFARCSIINPNCGAGKDDATGYGTGLDPGYGTRECTGDG